MHKKKTRSIWQARFYRNMSQRRGACIALNKLHWVSRKRKGGGGEFVGARYG